MADHFTRTALCPYCGSKADCATNSFGEGQPSEGDFSICLRCAGICVFVRVSDLLQLRKAQGADLMGLDKAELSKVFQTRRAVMDVRTRRSHLN
jgi:hypothetical protein